MAEDSINQAIPDPVAAGFDEPVNLDTNLAVTRTLTPAIADWCDLEPVSGRG